MRSNFSTVFFLAVVVVLACDPVVASTLPQEPKTLKGRVVVGDPGGHNWEPAVNLRIGIANGNVDFTDEDGVFHIELIGKKSPGAQVHLVVNGNLYAIQTPLKGKLLLPGDGDELIEVRLDYIGKPAFLTHPGLIEILVEKNKVGARPAEAEILNRMTLENLSTFRQIFNDESVDLVTKLAKQEFLSNGANAAIRYLEKKMPEARGALQKLERRESDIEKVLSRFVLLAGLYELELERDKAIELFRKLIDIRKDSFLLNNQFGRLLHANSENSKSETYLRIALRVAGSPIERGEAHNNLASVHYSRGENEQALFHFQEALLLIEKSLGSESPRVASLLSNLGRVAQKRSEYLAAAKYFDRALKIDAIEADELAVARDSHGLALALGGLNQLPKARSLLIVAIRTWESAGSSVRRELCQSLNSLGMNLYYSGENRELAELLIGRAIQIWSKAHSTSHSGLAVYLNNMAEIQRAKGRREEAQAILVAALEIDEAKYGPQGEAVARELGNLAEMLISSRRYVVGEIMALRAIAIDELVLGPVHSSVVIDLALLGRLRAESGPPGEAALLYQRLVSIILENESDLTLPDAMRINDLASTLSRMSEYEVAVSLYRDAIRITENNAQGKHNSVATICVNFSTTLWRIRRYADARQMMVRAIEVFELFHATNGYAHERMEESRANYEFMLRASDVPAEIQLSEEEISELLATSFDGTGELTQYPEYVTIKPDLSMRETLHLQATKSDGKRAKNIVGNLQEDVSPLLNRQFANASNQAIIAYNRDAFSEATVLLDRAIDNEYTGNPEAAMEARMLRAFCWVELGDHFRATRSLELELKTLAGVSKSVQGRIYHLLGISYWRNGDLQESRIATQTALELFEQIPDDNQRNIVSALALIQKLDNNQPPPPTPRVDMLAELFAAGERVNAREVLASLTLEQKSASAVKRVLGMRLTVDEVVDRLDDRIRLEQSEKVWFVPTHEKIYPLLDEIFGQDAGDVPSVVENEAERDEK